MLSFQHTTESEIESLEIYILSDLNFISKNFVKLLNCLNKINLVLMRTTEQNVLQLLRYKLGLEIKINLV